MATQFNRGDIILADLAGEPDPSVVMRGKRPVVCITDSGFHEVGIVIVVPITSLYNEKGKKKRVMSTDIILGASRYKGVLRKDSFVKTAHIRAVSRNKILKKIGSLSKRDLEIVNLRLILSLGLADTVEEYAQAMAKQLQSQSGKRGRD